MFKKPLVVGVRQLEASPGDQTIKTAIIELGRNTGNMMFTESLLQVLDGARWGSFGFTQEDLQDRDAVVLAAANWINDFEDFGWLADRLETTLLPVFLVGVGAQASLKMEVPQVRPGTQRLLDLVRDRSNSIAARGSFSCEVMEKLGIKTSIETGCPSLMLAGQVGPKISMGQISPGSYSMHSTRHGFEPSAPLQRYLYTQAFKHQFDLVLQSELPDIYYTLNSAEAEQIPEKGIAAMRDSYSTEDLEAIRSYLRNYGHVFLNYHNWIAFMKTRTFCFGTRIHGTIASLIAGVPATLICHDARTLEMAQTMSLPMLTPNRIDMEKDLSIETLFLPEKMLDFTAAYNKYYARYLAFFLTNSLAISPSFAPLVVP